MSDHQAATAVPAALRATIARDLAPVRALSSPLIRALAVLPLAALLLVAAPLFFDFRLDWARLGWVLGWGASILQMVLGIAVLGAALRDAVPGRTWSRSALAGWLALVATVLLTVTLASWTASPVRPRAWWGIGALCLTGSLVSALPVVALGSLLVARAWPTRPGVAGLLVGLAAGLMSDAGWRLFCHFSQPSHVIAAHLGGVAMAACLGAWLTGKLARSRKGD